MKIKLADLGVGVGEVWSIAGHEDKLHSNQGIKLYTPNAKICFQIRLEVIVQQYISKVAIAFWPEKRKKS
jgi:hypothetical protein